MLQVKASYKLSEDFKKGPAKLKKAKKPTAAKPKKVCMPLMQCQGAPVLMHADGPALRAACKPVMHVQVTSMLNSCGCGTDMTLCVSLHNAEGACCAACAGDKAQGCQGKDPQEDACRQEAKGCQEACSTEG